MWVRIPLQVLYNNYNMGFNYGIERAKSTLVKISSIENPPKRLWDGYSEIDVLTNDDVTMEDFKQIEKWKKEYINSQLPSLSDWTNFNNDKEVLSKVDKLLNELVHVLSKVIERNAQLLVEENIKL